MHLCGGFTPLCHGLVLLCQTVPDGTIGVVQCLTRGGQDQLTLHAIMASGRSRAAAVDFRLHIARTAISRPSTQIASQGQPHLDTPSHKVAAWRPLCFPGREGQVCLVPACRRGGCMRSSDDHSGLGLVIPQESGPSSDVRLNLIYFDCSEAYRWLDSGNNQDMRHHLPGPPR